MKTIEQIRAEIAAKHERELAVLARSEKYYGAIAELAEELQADIYTDMFDLNVRFTGNKLALEKAFRALRREGFVPDDRPKVKDTAFSTHFRQADGASVWISFSSAVCKRVQVGTRTVEEPIYEIQCDETPVATIHEPEAELLF